MLKRHTLRRYDGPKVIRREYAKFFGRQLTNDPQTFTEKVTYRMIAFHEFCDPIYTKLADKGAVREYIRDKVGAQYLVDLLWSGSNPRAIPFKFLPKISFAKTNHNSGSNMVLRQPIDKQAVIAFFQRHLAENYYWAFREFQYYRIKPKIMIEHFLDDGHTDGPLDYKFFCFRGKPTLVQVSDYKHNHVFFDLFWNKLPVHYRRLGPERLLPKPGNLHEMIEISAVLSIPFDFVRVDLFDCKGKVYAGELTFTPVAGKMKFDPPEWDLKLGQMWPSHGDTAHGR
jgi:hypothetical protein